MNSWHILPSKVCAINLVLNSGSLLLQLSKDVVSFSSKQFRSVQFWSVAVKRRSSIGGWKDPGYLLYLQKETRFCRLRMEETFWNERCLQVEVFVIMLILTKERHWFDFACLSEPLGVLFFEVTFTCIFSRCF